MSEPYQGLDDKDEFKSLHHRYTTGNLEAAKKYYGTIKVGGLDTEFDRTKVAIGPIGPDGLPAWIWYPHR